MGILSDWMVATWEQALAAGGGRVISCTHHGDGVEARAVFGSDESGRRLLIRWFPEEGIYCEGVREDIVAFHRACDTAGLRFQLGDMSLCG